MLIYIIYIDIIYKYQKTTQKLTKAFERFLRILLQLCRSRFRLIISEQKFRCKSQGKIWKSASLSILKYKTSKIAENRTNAEK